MYNGTGHRGNSNLLIFSKFFTLLLLALLALAAPGWAATYSVTNATDLDKALDKAVDAANNNKDLSGNSVNEATAENPHVITVAHGTYHLGAMLKLNNHITLKAADGAHPVLDRGLEKAAAVGDGNVIEVTSGDVTIDGFTITGGKTTGSGGGILLEGSAGNVTIENCVFSGDKAAYGGGIYHKTGTLTVRNCRFEGNEASSNGGGIYGDNQSGNLTVSECTFISNTAGSQGGGVFLNYKDGDTIKNCTFTSNSAVSGGDDENVRGGGIYMNLPIKSTQGVRKEIKNCVANCTFVNNTGKAGSEIYCGFAYNDVSVTIINSLLWNDNASEKPIIGGVNTGGYNFINLEHCAVPEGYNKNDVTTDNTDIPVTGWTPAPETGTKNGVTHAVYRLENYPALSGLIGKGFSTKDIPAPTIDQLGNLRSKTSPDIGAVEIEYITNLTINSITGEKSLTVTQGKTGTLSLGASVTVTYNSGKMEKDPAIDCTLAWKATGTLPDGISFTDGTLTVGTNAAATSGEVSVPVEVTATVQTPKGPVRSDTAKATLKVTFTEKSSESSDNKSGGDSGSGGSGSDGSSGGSGSDGSSGGSGSGGSGGSGSGGDEPASISVTSVTLNLRTLSLIVGGTAALTAKVTPDNATDKTVTWSSSNEAVATVDPKGVVTGISVGEATITARAGNKKATCAVTVEPAQDAITNITVTTAAAEMEVAAGLTATLDLSEYVTVMGTDASGAAKPLRNAALTITRADGGWPRWIALGQEGQVYAGPLATTKAGTASYTYTVTASAGGRTGTGSGKLTVTVINDPEVVKIATIDLSHATLTKEYNATLEAVGAAPITWGIVEGSLPRGLRLGPRTGRITGTPTTKNNYTFTVRASNGLSEASKQFVIYVKDVPPSGEWNVNCKNAKIGGITGETTIKGIKRIRGVMKGSNYTLKFTEMTGTNVKYSAKKEEPKTNNILEIVTSTRTVGSSSAPGGRTLEIDMLRNAIREHRYYIHLTARNSAGSTLNIATFELKRSSDEGSAKAALAAVGAPEDTEDTGESIEVGEGVTYFTNGGEDPDTGNISAVIGTKLAEGADKTYVFASLTEMLDRLTEDEQKRVVRLEFRKGAGLNGKLTAGDLQGLTGLTDLSIDESDVTELDLSGNTTLESLSLYGCEKLEKLKVSKCAALTSLAADECPKLAELTGVRDCPALESLSLYGAAVTALDVSDFAKLTNLDVTGCEKLTSLNAANGTALESLSANGCSSLTELDVSGCPALTNLDATSADVEALDLSGCAGLNSLSLYGARNLNTLMLSPAAKFEHFILTDSQVKELNLSGIVSMDTLDLSRNKVLTSLDVSGNDVLTELDVSGNERLETLNASNCGSLEKLTANGCAALYALNIAGCPALKALELYDAKWLTELNCAGRRLGHLDLDGLNRLSTLECKGQTITGVPMTQTLDLTPYAGYNPSRVKDLQGYAADGAEIKTHWDPETGTATFDSVPATVWYVYDTGLRDETMDVTLSLTGDPSGNDGPTSNRGSGGGCDAGFAGIAAAAVLGLAATKKRK